MRGKVRNPSHSNQANAHSLQPTPPRSAECESPPKTHGTRLCAYAETIWANRLVYLHFRLLQLSKHSQVCSTYPFKLSLETEGGGGRGDIRFVSSIHQSHLLQVHVWGCVLPLKQFTIHQLNRQMLNDFLHLLNLCWCAILDNQPAQCIPLFLQKRCQNMLFPNSPFWVRGQWSESFSR